MHEVFEDYCTHLTTLHDAIKEAIEGLPQEALDWSPGPEMNSLAVLIAHTAGSQRYWIGDVVAQDFSARDRDAEFKTKGATAEQLIERLDAVLAHSLAVVERLAPGDLSTVCVAPDGRRFQASWALFHALAHTSTHVGHVQITRQMWEIKKGG